MCASTLNDLQGNFEKLMERIKHANKATAASLERYQRLQQQFKTTEHHADQLLKIFLTKHQDAIIQDVTQNGHQYDQNYLPPLYQALNNANAGHGKLL
jgi:ribosomal protein S12 methylthiotransferase accessory factor YcaO